MASGSINRLWLQLRLERDNYVVGQTLDVRLENTKLDQLTAGTATIVGAAPRKPPSP